MPTVTPFNPAAVTSTIAPQKSAERPAAIETPQAAPEVKAEVPAMSPQLANLARKEKALRQQMRDMQAKEESLKAFQSEIDEARSYKTQIKSDPWSVLTGAGLTPEQVTQVILNQPKPEDLKFTELQKEIQSLKLAQENAVKQQSESAARQYEQAKAQIATEVKLLTDGDSAYEAIQFHGEEGHQAVVELIAQWFEAKNELLPVEQAAKEVEKELRGSLMKARSLSFLKEEAAPQSGDPAMKSQATQKLPMQTLSNRTAETSAKPLSANERKQRAILAFQGKLN